MVLITPDQAVAVALVFSRIIAFFSTFPLIFSAVIPHNVKVLLVVSFAFFTMLNFDIQVKVNQVELITFLILIVKEFFVGLSLGLIVNILISAFSYAGEIIGFLMGLTVMNIYNPAFGQTSVLSGFFVFYSIFYFSSLDLIRYL